MGFTLDSCPTVTLCCMSVPLRLGVLLAVLAGAAGAAGLLASYFAGTTALVASGVPKEASEPARLACFALGVLLLAGHALLAIAVWSQSDSLLEVYTWGVFVLVFPASIAAIVIAVWAAVQGSVIFAVGLLVTTLTSAILLLYFVVVVTNYKLSLP